MGHLILAGYMELIRRPTAQEERLIEILINQSSITTSKNWKEVLMVCDMDDGGMGGVIFVSPR
ncbi:DUF6984 family protein [Parapedobacter flavus]|uniref:DUF6984 family protein n=1 Tax=Parapedobacter flavus TaxID=3110225 RepID=UPI003F50E0A2